MSRFSFRTNNTPSAPGANITLSAPTTSHLNVVVQSSSLHWGGSKWLIDSPRVSSSGDSLRTTLLIFYPCCPMRGHIWTALLNLIDRPPTSSIFFRTSLLRPSFHPKPLHYLSHSPLILISMLLLISGDIHLNPGPIDSCSVCSRRVTWGNRSIQCTNCSLWVHLSYSGLSPADFRKISPGHSWTCPMCPSFSQPLPSLSHSNPVSSSFSVSLSFHTPNPHLHSLTPKKPYLQKLTTPPKQPRITPSILLITPN